tara:strand:+ start:34 stop:291 length:258 start_codon:yes stop_codon:yes gene_type:complete
MEYGNLIKKKMSTNKFIIVKPFLGSGKERKRKFFGLSTLGNPVIKEDGRFVQTPIDGTNYDPKIHGSYNWEEPQEEWVANSLHCS